MQVNFPEKASLDEVLKMKRFIYLPLITLVILVVITGTVLVPNLKKIISAQKELKADKARLVALENKLEVLKSFDESLLDEQVSYLEKVLPTNKVILEWMNVFTILAGREKIILGSVLFSPGSIATESATESALPASSGSEEKPEKPSRKETRRMPDNSSLKTFDLKLDLTGTYAAISNFLDSLEKTAPLIRVKNITLVTAKPNRYAVFYGLSYEEKITANLEVLVFYVAEKPKLGSVSSPVKAMGKDELDLYQKLTNFELIEREAATPSGVGREDIFAPF